ncbi:hypothetical protein SAMN05660662_2682 [Blastococcus aurantiacus]|uniref:Uncharacterized protein n=1 Tax=Blastococcus aurantiacus TaxID=1550231 RepID=A0A1G7MF68_9ACTN|nr:hypothetical protein [Blastococcus aurantiacus]SDF60468.1 hypothetical protein SAMN05660662_2682 [Blastococcus aurantiacus]
MPGLPGRPALVLAAPFAAVLAVVGGLGLDGSAVFGLAVATALVGAAWAGAAWEESRVGEVALVAGAGAAARTAGGLLVVCGAALLVGTAATLLAGALLAAAAVVLRRSDPSRAARAGAPLPDEPESPVVLSPLHPAAPTFRIGGAVSARTVLPPVRILSSRSLGEEWLRTTALLDAAPEPLTREAVAARRASVLDELERRDPEGFARWLAHGTDRGSNPAEFLREEPRSGGGAG